ncbi:MAG: chromosome segregation protein ScpA [Candidatus Nitrosopolaris wilkensis]|nr:MAG: chromosome segregation protein ScpA [Candidatus Nitrosopolaris wilkensis]
MYLDLELLQGRDNSDVAINYDSKKKIAEPPLNLLFNPSLVSKKDVWDIDISKLLGLLLNIIHASGKKDLRLCGIAALSSSMIHRLKVESIFRLEKVAMQKKTIIDPVTHDPITDLDAIELPFRFESTYPVSLEELLQVLENMIFEISNPDSRKKKKLTIEPVQGFDFDQYSQKFEQIIREYEDKIFGIVNVDLVVMFRMLISKMGSLEVARYFIALLYLVTKGKINLEQSEDSEDIKITIK